MLLSLFSGLRFAFLFSPFTVKRFEKWTEWWKRGSCSGIYTSACIPFAGYAWGSQQGNDRYIQQDVDNKDRRVRELTKGALWADMSSACYIYFCIATCSTCVGFLVIYSLTIEWSSQPGYEKTIWCLYLQCRRSVFAFSDEVGRRKLWQRSFLLRTHTQKK